MKGFTEKELKISFAFSEAGQEKTAEQSLGEGVEGSRLQDPARKVEPIVKSAVDKFGGKIVKQYYVKEEK